MPDEVQVRVMRVDGNDALVTAESRTVHIVRGVCVETTVRHRFYASELAQATGTGRPLRGGLLHEVA